jgi:hypothetical protein
MTLPLPPSLMIHAGFDPGGSPGTPFSVLRAIAVGGQLVRVVFSAEPRHASCAGINDARNGANYQVAIVVGSGTDPQAVACMATVASYPAYGLIAVGEFGVDLQTDRPMVVGLTYRVTCSPAIISAGGILLSAPYDATFVGAQRPALVRQLRRKPGLVDLASDPFKGGIMIDSAGDRATQEGLDGTKKRIWRRALVAKDSFACLPGYGLGYDFKVPATTSKLNTLKTDLTQQIQQEPDVASSKTGVLMDSRGLLSLSIAAKTTDGQDLQAGIQNTLEGGVTAS